MNATEEPGVIEERIAGTRAQLERTLEELEARLSPSRRLRSGMERITPSITNMIRLDHVHATALFRRFRPNTSSARKWALAQNACLALEIHAQLEEEIFYPALRESVGANPVLDKSGPEHDEMRKLIAELRRSYPGMEGFDANFLALAREVLHHVADEETVLLPLAEEFMSDRLGALGMQMTRRRVELLGPHVGELAMTTAKSFPLLLGGVIAGGLALATVLLRPSRRVH